LIEQLLEKLLLSAAARWITGRPAWVAGGLVVILGGLSVRAGVRKFVVAHPETLGGVCTVLLLVVSLGIVIGQHGKLRRAIRGTCKAGHEIAEHLRPVGPQRTLLRVAARRLVHGNYDGEVAREYRIRALEPFHMWEIRLGVSDKAKPVGQLSDLDFSVDADKGKIAYVQSLNSPREKRVVLFFLPYMEKGEERTVTIRYRWPQMYAGLRIPRWGREFVESPGEEKFIYGLAHQSTDPISFVEFDVFIDPALGAPESFRVTVTGNPPGAAIEPKTLQPEKSTPWGGWSLTATDVTQDLEMVLRKTSSQKKGGH
jgi:hypothetical protein